MNSSSHSCGCGGHAQTEPRKRTGIPVPILRDEPHGGGCGCGGHGHHHHHEGHGHSGGCQCGGGGICPRKYHSAAGLILGAMLILHFSISFLGFWPERYQTILTWIHQHSSLLIGAEILLIGIPLAVHVGYGLRFLFREGIVLNGEKHHYGSRTRFFWQRITAVVLLLFIAFHLATLHRWGFHLVYQLTHWSGLQRYAESGLFSPVDAYASSVDGIRFFWNSQNPWNPGNVAVVLFYLVAVVGAVYHLANGVSTSAMVWHVTGDSSPQARRVWTYCKIGGAALLLIGLAAWYAFTLGARGH